MRPALAVLGALATLGACASSPLVPAPPPGTRVHISMVISSDGWDQAMHTAVVNAVRARMAQHPSVVFEVEEQGPFPRQGYMEYRPACEERLRQGIAYVIDIDLSEGNNATSGCADRDLGSFDLTKHDKITCRKWTYTASSQSSAAFVARTIRTSTCEQVRHWHQDSVLADGPEEKSRPRAHAALGARIADWLDESLPR